VDFDRAPFLVIWETTRACDLACRHCRAEAVPGRDPRELSTAEARLFLERVRDLGRPVLVMTGGDPLKRPDTVDLVAHGVSLGLRVALTPSGTPLVTPRVLRDLKEAGLARLAVSLDGSTAASHDAFRGVAGSWEWTMRILREARAIGLPTQVNTTVTSANLGDFDALAALAAELGVVLWSVFFVVPTGRARLEDVPGAEDFEAVFNRMFELSRTAPFDVKSTAAPQYRRVVLQRTVAERRGGRRPAAAGLGGPGSVVADAVGRARAVNDGDGLLFVSHTGEIFPSGFLPLSAGNVRTHDLAAVYRDAPLFRALRDRSLLKGKCGACEYRVVCGGSRARAYAATGDWLESDAWCVHVPARWRPAREGDAAPAAAASEPGPGREACGGAFGSHGGACTPA
jgi:radical SAM protein